MTEPDVTTTTTSWMILDVGGDFIIRDDITDPDKARAELQRLRKGWTERMFTAHKVIVTRVERPEMW